MTTYLLHGGETSKDLSGNQRFFDSFSELVDKPTVKILLCFWARSRDDWDRLTQRDTAKIAKNTSKQLVFHVVADPQDLYDKIDEFDVLYVAGGSAEPLESLYPELGFLKEKLHGKVYAGSSMGAFMASQSYVLSSDYLNTSTTHQGLGLLPIQTLCHWEVENRKEFKLGLLDTQLPILVLNQAEFVTIYQK